MQAICNRMDDVVKLRSRLRKVTLRRCGSGLFRASASLLRLQAFHMPSELYDGRVLPTQFDVLSLSLVEDEVRRERNRRTQ